MPKWLKGMVAPTLVLWLYALAFALALAKARSQGGELPTRADMVSRIAIALIMAFWVTADARKRDRRLGYDFGSFVFFAWPVIMPVYLFQTRGARAFLTLLCFGGICLIAVAAAFLVR
jgi:hypothetical protein